MTSFLSEALIERLGWTLLHFLWQGALLGALAALGLSIWRSSASYAAFDRPNPAKTAPSTTPAAALFVKRPAGSYKPCRFLWES